MREVQPSEAESERSYGWPAPLFNGCVGNRRLNVATVARLWEHRIIHALASVASYKKVALSGEGIGRNQFTYMYQFTYMFGG